MKRIIAIIITISALYPIKTAVAISENELMTADGNIWAVYDELEINREYNIIFDTLGDDNIYNDEIIKIF